MNAYAIIRPESEQNSSHPLRARNSLCRQSDFSGAGRAVMIQIFWLRSAKALGLTIPAGVLSVADEVIE